MEHNFYIGQDIVAIVNHSQNIFKKDDVFVVLDAKISECICKKPIIDIGIKVNNKKIICTTCRKGTTANGAHWVNSRQFAPLDDITNIEELTEILKSPILQEEDFVLK